MIGLRVYDLKLPRADIADYYATTDPFSSISLKMLVFIPDAFYGVLLYWIVGLTGVIIFLSS